MSLLEELKNSGTEMIGECNSCRSDQYFTDRSFAKLLGLLETFGVQKCRNCGLRWLSPRPSESGCRILYSDHYYFAPHDLPSYDDIARERQSVFNDRLAHLVATWKPATLLDFGAATGVFVAAARRAGLDAEGVELSEDARNHAMTQHHVKLYSPDQFDTNNRRFDVIHMNHVLEHLPDPWTHLRWCHTVLSQNGGIIIEVPQQICNDLDRVRRRFARPESSPRFSAYSVHHTYFYTHRTICQLVKAAGFVIERSTTRNTPLNGNSSLSRKLAWHVTNFASHIHSGGDVIEVWARKR